MYIPEGTTHKPYSGFYSVPAYSTGWIGSASDPIPQGSCPPEFLESLKGYQVVNLYRGYHRCEICHTGDSGNGEYWLVTTDGKHYVLPAMVRHYVENHGYCPPTDLLQNISHALTQEEVTALQRDPTEEEVAEMERVRYERDKLLSEEQDRQIEQRRVQASNERMKRYMAMVHSTNSGANQR